MMAVKSSSIIVGYDKMPLHLLEGVAHDKQFMISIIFYACEFLYSEDAFVEEVFSYLYSTDPVVEREDLADYHPFAYYQQDLFMIQLSVFFDAFKGFINMLFGYVPRKLEVLDQKTNFIVLGAIG